MKYTQAAKQRISRKVGASATLPILSTVVATVFLAHIPIVPDFLRLTYGALTFGGW